MFGYVRARKDTLTEESWADYEAVYCGLCRTLGERRGLTARLFLNYDFAFLAMLLAPAGAGTGAGCRRCLLHPVKGKPACTGGEWLDIAADESVILAWWKLRDTVADSGFFRGFPARLLSLFLKRAYRGARAARPEFDAGVAQCLAQLRELEEARCPSIDRTADCFARLLAQAAPESGDSARNRVIGQLLYHLGRWIYLVDGVDDVEEDRRAGRFNPVLARFPSWTEEDQTYLRQSMDQSLGLMGAAFQLLEPNPWTPVVENVIYSGLPGVEELVFTGKWREHQRKGG